MIATKIKAAGWGAKAAFKSTDDEADCIPTNLSGQFESKHLPHVQSKLVQQPLLQVVPPIKPTPICLVDYPIGSAEFELLKSKFNHPKSGVLLQHLEFLNRKFGVPDNGFYRNIKPCGNMPAKQTISGHIGISSPRILGAILNEVRVSYTFKRGVLLNPSEIDFQGKLYAGYYSPSDKQRTVRWYRNEKLINQLYADIVGQLLKQNQAKKLRHVVPREPLCESSSDGASEPSSEVSYTYKEVEVKKEETEEEKTNNSLKLVTSIDKNHSTKATGKANPKTQTQTQTQSNSLEIDTKSVLQVKGKLTAQLGKGIYPYYKTYCESLEKGILMPNVPSAMVARKLGKMVEAFNGFGFKQEEIEHFFVLLAEGHNDVSEYLKDHDVWQVKNHYYFIGEDLLEKKANLFASWYKKQVGVIIKAKLAKVVKPVAPVEYYKKDAGHVPATLEEILAIGEEEELS
jgi:hypothetical protein